MKIALVTPYYFPTVGGYSTFSYNLAKAFAFLGHRVDIITPGPNGQSIQNLSDNLRVLFFPKHSIPMRQKLGILKNFDFRNFCLLYNNNSFYSEVAQWLLDNKYDVVHTNGFPFEALPSTLQNEPISVHTFHTQPLKPAKLPNRIMYRRLFEFIDHATCVSQRISSDVASNLGVFAHNIISNGVDLGFFKPVLRADAGKGLVVGSITNFTWKSKAVGLKMLIDSVKVLENENLSPEISKVIIVGGGKFKEEIMKCAEKVDLKNVVFKTATYEEMPSIYNEFDIYIHASGQEGFPIAIVEALACGKPVVSSADFPEMASSKAVQTVKSQEEMVDALRNLITDVDKRKEKGILARVEAENFSWKNIANCYLELYNTRK